ncbi:MAG: hypothetical protein ACQESR_10855 [Planctomycetota bacterium]
MTFEDRSFFRCLPSACGVGLVWSLLLVITGQVALAQSFEWDDDEIGSDYQEQMSRSKKKTAKTQIVMGRLGLSNNQAAFEGWYRDYLFPAMASRKHLGELYKNRNELAKDLQRAADPETHQFLRELAYEEASKRVTGNYHPAVRFNAMLIIGNLNQVELKRAERLPPVRLPKAFDFLLSELEKPDQLDVLRLGAMVGIKRHLLLVRERPQDQPIPDAKKAEIVGLMETMASETSAPDERPQEVHTWMRRRALDVLGAVGRVGDNREIFNLLVDIVSDPDESMALRCTAARVIADLDYTDVSGIEPVETAEKLGALAVQACLDEEAWVEEQQDELEKATDARSGARGGYPGMGGGYEMESGYGTEGGGYGTEGGGYGTEGGGYDMEPGYGRGSEYPGGRGARGPRESEEVQELMENARRRLKLPIYCVQIGIRGEEKQSFGSDSDDELGSIAQLATEETQEAKIQEILEALDEMIAATDPPEDVYQDRLETMMVAVRESIDKLTQRLPGSVLVEPTAEEGEEDGLESALPGEEAPDGDEPATKPSPKGPPGPGSKPGAIPAKKPGAKTNTPGANRPGANTPGANTPGAKKAPGER